MHGQVAVTINLAKDHDHDILLIIKLTGLRIFFCYKLLSDLNHFCMLVGIKIRINDLYIILFDHKSDQSDNFNLISCIIDCFSYLNRFVFMKSKFKPYR